MIEGRRSGFYRLRGGLCEFKRENGVAPAPAVLTFVGTRMLTILLASCCGPPWDEPLVARFEDFGGGALAVTVTNEDGSTIEAEAAGVSAEAWDGNFADGQSGVTTSQTFPADEGPPPDFDGIVYVQVCAPMTVDGCGEATVCLQSGWIDGAQIDGQVHAQSGGVLVFGASFGTSSWKAVVDSRLDSVVSGDATVSAPTWREGADACFKDFTPSLIAFAWEFDAAPMATDEAPGNVCM